MKLLTLVTGGARSGKSSFSESLIENEGEEIIYIATGVPFDQEMKDRIKKHRENRPSNWETIEKYRDFKDIVELDSFKTADSVILDCVTIMINNLLFENNIDFESISMGKVDEIEKEIFLQIDELLDVLSDKNTVIVTNEVGLGIVPDGKISRIFRDIAGRINQYIAQRADRVYFVVSGIPTIIKGMDK